MVAIDTNVLIRYITRDDPEQERRARRLFLDDTVFVPRTVLMETEWVLRFTYRYSPAQIHDALSMIIENDAVLVEDTDQASMALAGFREGLDFADALHLSSCGELDTFATFDKPLFKRAARVFVKPVVISP